MFFVRRERYRYQGRAYYAVRKGPWKLSQNDSFEPMKLYNLDEDPLEQNPLSNDYPIFEELVTALRKHIIEAGVVPWRKYPVMFK